MVKKVAKEPMNPQIFAAAPFCIVLVGTISYFYSLANGHKDCSGEDCEHVRKIWSIDHDATAPDSFKSPSMPFDMNQGLL